MAVTISITELLAALRMGDSAEETAEVTRLLDYATLAVEQHASAAPTIAQNEAVRRLAGFLFDMPEASRGMGFANALRSSGAARMLLPYKIHRLGLSDAVAEAQATVGSTDNPVTAISYSGDVLTVTYADGTSEDFTIMSGVGGGADQTARDAAEDAQTRADSAYTKADAAESLAETTETGLEAHEATPHGGGGAPTYTLLGTGHLNGIRAGFAFDTAGEVAALRAAWVTSDYLEFRFVLSPGRFVTRQVRTVPQPLPATAIQVYCGLATSAAGAAMIVDFTLTATSASVGTGIDGTWGSGSTVEIWGVS